jgi:hypothetical protein
MIKHFNSLIDLRGITNKLIQQGRIAVISGFILFSIIAKAFSQTELQAWGNITGIRVEGQLMEFETSLRIVGDQWSWIHSTGKELQSPVFSRDGDRQVVITTLDGIKLNEAITDIGYGRSKVTIQFTASADTSVAGAFFCLSFPQKDFSHGHIIIDKEKPLDIVSLNQDNMAKRVGTSVREFSINAAKRKINIQCGEPEELFIRQKAKTSEEFLEVYFPLHLGKLMAGQTGEKTFTLQTTGLIDKNPVRITLDTRHPGRAFAGLGGNFRIQNLKTDPQVIDYCLNNLRVAWGRVEMPWRYWQPEKESNPISLARDGHLDPHVQRAMEMAQKLQERGIPVILTDWSAPNWAIIGKPVFSHRNSEPWGNPLNPDSLTAIYQSIADYIQFLQEQYGVRIRFFSFNESDLGIYIRQTGEEHAELIKGLGKYFLARGLKTKILLGDNSDATTYAFIDPALKDTSTHPYIGAVSFHSWRGWETEILSRWAADATQLNLPLIVGEGSIDAAAWAYPAIFEEQTYAMEEINLYVRLLAICQPLSILQWQLTSDYSPLTGGGIFGKEGPLAPTQRFWNLKQLASTPEGLKYMPVSCESASVTCAALGNSASGKYTLHIVNNGSERKVLLSGIPVGVKSFRIFSTGKTQAMLEGRPVTVQNSTAAFILPAGCFTTLITM